MAAPDDETVEDKTVARRMADEAAQHYLSGDYERARDLFHRADAVYPAPTLALWEARSLEKLGRLVEAEERYASVLRYVVGPDDPEVYRDASVEAKREIARLRERIPTVTIQLKGDGADAPNVEVEIDSRRIKPAMLGYPVPVDPGHRSVVVQVSRIERFREVLELNERDRRVLNVWLAPQPPAVRVRGREGLDAEPQLRHDEPEGGFLGLGSLHVPLGWLAVGVGSAGVVTGVVAGSAASKKHSTLAAHCVDDDCPPEYHEELEDFRQYRTFSTVGYVAGAAGVALGVTLLVTAPEAARASPTKGVTLRIGPSYAGVGGRF